MTSPTALAFRKAFSLDPVILFLGESGVSWGDYMYDNDTQRGHSPPHYPEFDDLTPTHDTEDTEDTSDFIPVIHTKIRDTSSDPGIMIKRLPRDITKESLHDMFMVFGTISKIHIPINTDRTSQYYGTIRGFAFINFHDHHAADSAASASFDRFIITPIRNAF
jgi:hypothetical protein